MVQNKDFRFCGGVFFALLLKARKVPKANQDYCFRDLLKIFDRSSGELRGNSLSTITSRFKNCDPELSTEYIRFGDDIIVGAFDERLKISYSSVLNEVVEFIKNIWILKRMEDG